MSLGKRFRSAVTGLFVSRKEAEARPRETVSEEISALKVLGLDAVEELSNAVKWLDRNNDRCHAPNCTHFLPSAKCSCGLNRVMTGLRATLHDLKHGL